jgi:hypothetical protein
LCPCYQGFFDETFDASKGVQKGTASDKYFCSSPERCRKPARDVVLCHHHLKICGRGMDVAPDCISKNNRKFLRRGALSKRSFAIFKNQKI